MMAFCGTILLVNFTAIGYFMFQEVGLKQKCKRCREWFKHKCVKKKVKKVETEA